MNFPFMVDCWHLAGTEPTHAEPPEQWTQNYWYHCQRDEPGLEQWLLEQGLPQSLVNAVLTEDTRPRFQELDSGNFLMILRGVNLNKGEAPDDMLSLRMLYYKGSLITMRKKPFKAVSQIREELTQGTGPRSISEVLLAIVENLHQRIDEVLDHTEEEVDELQEAIDTIDYNGQRQLTKMHRQLLKLHRFLKPQALALSEFVMREMPLLKSAAIRQEFHNQRDTIQRILEDIEAQIDQVWMLREHIQQALAEKMNRNTYTLSLIAGVFLPLGFVTGLLGVNVGGIPGSNSATAFAVLCALLVLCGFAEFLLLRRLKFW